MDVKTVTQIFVLNTLTRIHTILWDLRDVYTAPAFSNLTEN